MSAQAGWTGEPWTASIGQQRHFAYQRRFPDSAAFNVPIGATLRGDVDDGALAAAVAAVAARHDSLRSTFSDEAGFLQAFPRPPEAVPVFRHDLTDAGTEAERAEQLAAIGAAEAARPFDLETEPAMRAHLVRLSAEEVAVVLNVHHVSFDGWSSPVLFRDLSAAYAALASGRSPDRGEPDDVYADFAMAQRKWLRSGRFDEQLAYWARELRTPAPPVHWPQEGVEKDAPWWAGDMAWASLPLSLVSATQAAAQAAHTTLFGWTLAVYQVALHRFLDAPSVAAGTPYSARTDRRWHDVVGFFANTLVMGSTFDPGRTFRALVRDTHEQALRGHRNQDVPFGVVLETLKPQETPGRTPYFQTMFIVQNTPLPDPDFGALRLRTTKIVTGSARYDLTFCLGWRRGRLCLELETRRSALAQETAIRFARFYFGLLAASVADPDTRVGDAVPLPVDLGIRRGRERSASVDGLFEGLVGDWRPAPAALPAPVMRP